MAPPACGELGAFERCYLQQYWWWDAPGTPPPYLPHAPGPTHSILMAGDFLCAGQLSKRLCQACREYLWNSDRGAARIPLVPLMVQQRHVWKAAAATVPMPVISGGISSCSH